MTTNKWDYLKKSARIFLVDRRAARAAQKYFRKTRTQYAHRLPAVDIGYLSVPDSNGYLLDQYGKGNKNGAIYLDSFDGLRVVGDAHEIVQTRDRHTGWYTDHYCYDLAVGVVVQLPARRGVPRYVAGVRFTGSEGVALFPRDSSDDKDDVARWADGAAERIAEESREYNARDQADQDIIESYPAR